MSVKNQLAWEVSQFKKFGTEEDRHKAEQLYGELLTTVFNIARNEGGTSFEFDSASLPDECVRYFKYLCENDELKFSQRKNAMGEIVYTVSWNI